MTLGICHLCGSRAALSNSHVFPEFFYQRTYDASHRFISVTSHPLHGARPMQKGLRERLLCAACESLFSKHEAYAADLLRQLDQTPESPPGRIIVQGFDPNSFRLFGLSLLWRAHVAKGYMFRDVKLGPHAQRIRAMLRNENPGQPHEYPFTFAKIVGLDTHGHILIAPMRAKYQGHTVYHFMARGYEWVFLVSSASSHVREIFPYVGSEKELVIATVAHDKQQLFSALRKAFPSSLAG
jgi:hypothetical protein